MSPIELGLALVAGTASFISPCCLPMVPMYLSYLAGIAGRSQITPVAQPPELGPLVVAQPSRALVLMHATWFVIGFSVVFVALGASASVVGSFLLPHLLFVRHAAGILIILFGLQTAGILRLSWLYRERRLHVDPASGAGMGRSALLGFAFGAGWSPCIGPMLGSILLLSSSTGTLQEGVILLMVYSLGLGIPFLVSAFFVQGLAGLLRRLNRFFGAISLLSGALLVAMGIMVYMGVFARLASLFPALI